MKLLVLDGNSILNRAFYGIKLLTTKDGQYTNAIYGFLNILLKLLDGEKPSSVAIAFDLKAPTFRHKMYDGYKAQRKGMPEELAAQLPILKQLLADMGYKLVEKEGYEADDILGTLAAACEERQVPCLLATGDRDSLQLVRDDVTVLLTTTQMGRGETTRMDVAAVAEKYGVTPPQLIDVKALMGDASDNIPGVAGIGEKTALGLIAKFSTLEGVYENIDDAFIKPGQRQKLLDGRDSAFMSRELAEICRTVPIDTDPADYAPTAPDAAAVAATLSRLEMVSILDRLHLGSVPVPEDAPTAAPVAEIATAPLPSAPRLSGRVYIAPAQDGWAVLPAGGDTLLLAADDAPGLAALLADEAAEKWVFSSKELHKIALAAGGQAHNMAFDAKLAAYLLNPAASDYTLARLVPEYGFSPAFSCAVCPEAGALASLFEKLHSEVQNQEMLPLLTTIEQPLAEVLAGMELTGIALDADALRRFGTEMQAQLQKHLADIYEMAGGAFNVNSPKQLGEVLFDKLELPHRKKTKSGWSTDAETLESLRSYHPIIDSILEYRIYQKLNSTYVEGLLKEVGPDGRIHSTFNQTEARTGRISSNEPNLQNIPVRTELGSRLRAFFVAPAGRALADADYSQIELRILASISGDAAMQEAFRNGEDIHRATAARVNGVKPEEVTSAMRSAAKAVNFGIVYGIGAFSLSKDIGVSVKEADAFINTYLDTFPGVKQYMHDAIENATKTGYAVTLFGRRRPLPELASSNHNIHALGERMAMNTPIQGTAADVIKLAMIRVFNRLRDEGLQSPLVLQVHDELIVEALDTETQAVAAILQEEMTGAAALAVPLEADVHTGANWLDAKG